MPDTHPDFTRARSLSDRDWLDLLAGNISIDGVTAPPLPAGEIQRSFVGASGYEALFEASKFYSRIIATCRSEGIRFDQATRALDFGCGWGRIYRFFIRDCAPHNLIGIDIDEGCVELCRKSMPYGTFLKSSIMPPSPFAASDFDVIFAYSVFSHLAKDACEAWLQELARVLKRGGLVFLTTLKDEHIEVWRRQSVEGNEFYRRLLNSAGFSYSEWLERARAGGFLYVPTGGGGIRESTFYGEAVINGYLQAAVPRWGFTVLAYDPGPDFPQALFVLKRSR